MGSQNWELLIKPMTNILLYRWLPASLRQKAWDHTLTDADNDYIDECNRKLQSLQKNAGLTFVSRTTITAPKYNLKPLVALRVVIGNPLTTELDIDAVFWDQDAIIMSHSVTDDVTASPAAIIPREVGVQCPSGESGKEDAVVFWDAVWTTMSSSMKIVFNNDIETYYEAMITPDCYLDARSKKMVADAKETNDMRKLR